MGVGRHSPFRVVMCHVMHSCVIVYMVVSMCPHEVVLYIAFGMHGFHLFSLCMCVLPVLFVALSSFSYFGSYVVSYVVVCLLC